MKTIIKMIKEEARKKGRVEGTEQKERMKKGESKVREVLKQR